MDSRFTPKVVLCITRKYVIFRDPLIQPKLFRLQVWLEAILRISFKVGNIKTILGEFVYVRQQLPRVPYSFFLEDVEKDAPGIG